MNNNYFSDLKLPVAIIGLGLSGQSVQNLLVSSGISKESILTFDDKSPKAMYNNSDKLITEGKPKTLVVSPGVPLKSPWIVKAKESGIEISSELSLAYKILTSEKIIAVTGSIGKSTTVCLLRAALEKFSSSFFVGGNLGIPLAQYAVDLIHGIRSKAEWVVLELSSYQLENFPELKAEISVFTYFTSNHLERYLNRDDYFQTKWNLEKHTKQFLIMNKNGGELRDWVEKRLSSVPQIWTNRQSPLMGQYELQKAQLLGVHNLDNIALAAEVSHKAQWPESAYDGLREFAGLPHRVENLGSAKGIYFVNDSKATTMESVKTAVQAVTDSINNLGHLHILLGGKDKNLPWKELNSLSYRSLNRFYFFGECGKIAQSQSGLSGATDLSMIQACELAFSRAKPGDAILLSPGGTSLDAFKSFEDRGEFFRSYFEKVIKS